jgi:hypothetical protein
LIYLALKAYPIICNGKEARMYYHILICVAMAVCLCAVPVLAASLNASKGAVHQIRIVEKSLVEADKDSGQLVITGLKARKGFKVQERSIGVTKAKHDVGALTARGDYVSRGANDAGQSGKLGQDASHGSDLKT